jgi:hypothetical protein
MVPWWHAWFAATVTVTVALALLTGAPALVLLPLGLLVVDYVALGAHALRPMRSATPSPTSLSLPRCLPGRSACTRPGCCC